MSDSNTKLENTNNPNQISDANEAKEHNGVEENSPNEVNIFLRMLSFVVVVLNNLYWTSLGKNIYKNWIKNFIQKIYIQLKIIFYFFSG